MRRRCVDLVGPDFDGKGEEELRLELRPLVRGYRQRCAEVCDPMIVEGVGD